MATRENIHSVSIRVDGYAARALLLNGVERIRAPGRTFRLVFDVSRLAEEVRVGRRGTRRLMMLERPPPLGSIDVLAVDGAGLPARGLDGVGEVGNGNRRQQTDDGDDDHDFQERESGSVFCFHGVPVRERYVSSVMIASGRARDRRQGSYSSTMLGQESFAAGRGKIGARTAMSARCWRQIKFARTRPSALLFPRFLNTPCPRP